MYKVAKNDLLMAPMEKKDEIAHGIVDHQNLIL